MPFARTLYHRAYSDFLMRSRLGEYRRLLLLALQGGYRFKTIRDAHEELAGSDGPSDSDRWLIVRHDIDTDPGTARRMFEVEQELGTVGTFYFRLSTIDAVLMRAIEAAGGEASYHYEELATVAKRRGVRKGEAGTVLEEARALFARNIEALRTTTGLPMSTVASHGDFANRYLGTPNTVILADRDLRRRTGIALESYDAAFMDRVGARFSDEGAPRFWVSGNPDVALGEGVPLVYLLVHPRHWRSNAVVNARDDIGRIAEWLLYWLRRRSAE